MGAQNYKELNTLYDKYSGEGLEILAFPCNQFGAQEPGTNAEVLQFAQRKGAKFPVMAKVDVNGAGAHPLFTWLKDNTSTGFPPPEGHPLELREVPHRPRGQAEQALRAHVEPALDGGRHQGAPVREGERLSAGGRRRDPLLLLPLPLWEKPRPMGPSGGGAPPNLEYCLHFYSSQSNLI